MELRKKKKKQRLLLHTNTTLLVALVVTFPLESTGLEKNAKLSPSSCRRNAENVTFPLLLLFSNTHCHTFHRSRLQFGKKRSLSFLISLSFSYTLLFFFLIIIDHNMLIHITHDWFYRNAQYSSQDSPIFTTTNFIAHETRKIAEYIQNVPKEANKKFCTDN